jgi:hypothetical protein
MLLLGQDPIQDAQSGTVTMHCSRALPAFQSRSENYVIRTPTRARWYFERLGPRRQSLVERQTGFFISRDPRQSDSKLKPGSRSVRPNQYKALCRLDVCGNGIAVIETPNRSNLFPKFRIAGRHLTSLLSGACGLGGFTAAKTSSMQASVAANC